MFGLETREDRERKHARKAGMDYAIERIKAGDSPVILYREHYDRTDDYFSQGVVAAVLADALDTRAAYRKKQEDKKNEELRIERIKSLNGGNSGVPGSGFTVNCEPECTCGISGAIQPGR